MISLVIVIVSVVLSYTGLDQPETKTEKTLGVNTNITVKTSPSPKQSMEPSPFLKPTLSPSSTPSSEPQADLEPNLGFDEWIYPGANVVSKSSTSLSLETGENTDKITDWYKEVIKSKGFSAKSFVTTKTNDNVLNKLSGAKEGSEVSIEIKKDEGQAKAQVTVNLD